MIKKNRKLEFYLWILFQPVINIIFRMMDDEFGRYMYTPHEFKVDRLLRL